MGYPETEDVMTLQRLLAQPAEGSRTTALLESSHTRKETEEHRIKAQASNVGAELRFVVRDKEPQLSEVEIIVRGDKLQQLPFTLAYIKYNAGGLGETIFSMMGCDQLGDRDGGNFKSGNFIITELDKSPVVIKSLSGEPVTPEEAKIICDCFGIALDMGGTLLSQVLRKSDPQLLQICLEE